MLSIANLESIQNNFQYDDSIPFERVTNPPVINKGGLNTNIAKSVLTELPPTTTFSCIVDWVGYVFNIDQSYELTIEEKVADTSEFDNYRRQTEQAAKLNHIHNVQDKAQQFLCDLQECIPFLTFHLSDHGRFAYKHLADLYRDGEHVGTFCFGGTTNNGTAALMLKGKGCSGVNMSKLRKFLEPFPNSHLTRVDVAHDDLEGKRTVDWYVEQFHSGGFFIKGATPKPRNGGDWTSKDDVKGRTFYVGSKRNGKEACIYEKGKQLGDTLSQWVRVEVRFTHDDHLVPFDILTSPQMFFAGSYPVLKDTSVFHDRCVVIKKHAVIVLAALIGHGRASYGKLVNVLVEIGHTSDEIVKALIVPGCPKRLIIPLAPEPNALMA